MPASPLARVRFLARLEAAEAAVAVRDWDALDRLVREMSPMAESIESEALLGRFDAAFALTDPECRAYAFPEAQ